MGGALKFLKLLDLASGAGHLTGLIDFIRRN
jgi:hypothetical protein